ncbi:hypothetical protein PGT21_000089 [Puccinia graminis f. sp. tritici]|uniref:Uncharacterized protein n=1 Tax=Puccinia graminis f. sp. tritici TaxID=56615 RepID=A0A5B0PBN3_PUCGR|nr:hypothetical protein PGT21_000089 [Puccinia graminis f. sp. tritici]
MAQATKINVNSTSLDKYDMYADPILLESQTPAGIKLNVLKEIDGNTRMEFGWYTKDMLKAILLFTQFPILKIPIGSTNLVLIAAEPMARWSSITPDIVNPSQYHSGDFSDASRTSLSRLTQITRNAASSLESPRYPPNRKARPAKKSWNVKDAERLKFLFDRLSVGCCTPTQRKAATKHLGGKNDLDENLRIASWYCSDLSGYTGQSPKRSIPIV